MTTAVKALRGWERFGLTWCRTSQDLHAEVSRQKNHFGSGIIEWHTLVWQGRDRDRPLVDQFSGQDLDEAVALAEEWLP